VASRLNAINTLEPLGVSEHQFYVLTALAHLGPQVQAHLSEPLKIDKATMVGLVNDLEHKGLVQRQPHPSDRRAVLVSLTDAGQALLRRGYEISNHFAQRFFKGITQEEQELLHTILKRLAANANELAATFENNE
jgi:MarR family transcriptional regulator, lower aerobic nicotinate degradation pathway regulator